MLRVWLRALIALRSAAECATAAFGRWALASSSGRDAYNAVA